MYVCAMECLKEETYHDTITIIIRRTQKKIKGRTRYDLTNRRNLMSMIRETETHLVGKIS